MASELVQFGILAATIAFAIGAAGLALTYGIGQLFGATIAFKKPVRSSVT